jgi:hypothetical protein
MPNQYWIRKYPSRTDAIVIDFSKAFDLVPHDKLLIKFPKSG